VGSADENIMVEGILSAGARSIGNVPLKPVPSTANAVATDYHPEPPVQYQ
jgi:hypothetical protein